MRIVIVFLFSFTLPRDVCVKNKGIKKEICIIILKLNLIFCCTSSVEMLIVENNEWGASVNGDNLCFSMHNHALNQLVAC